MRTLIEIRDFLLDNKYSVVGCSERDIQSIETYYDISLPELYKEFLRLMGKSAGDFMKGSSVFFHEILDLRNDSIDLLKENGFRDLPANAFVFYMHQGYQFAFFLVNNDDNPKVYYYSEVESMDDFAVVSETLIEFLNIQFEISVL